MNPLNIASRLFPQISDFTERWDDILDDARDFEEQANDRDYRLIDVTGIAGDVRYNPSKRRRLLGLPGRVKRTAYRPVDLTTRKVVLVIHQTGVARSPEALARRVHRTTAHEVWGPDGTVYVVHPDETRLIAANRLDRAPFHAINLEVAGNFEGVAGSGRYVNPEVLGRSTMTRERAFLHEQRLVDKIASLRACGIEIYMIAPHRVAGRDQRGRPNRQICCGQANWQMAERVAARTGVPVPDDDYEIGGLTIPAIWRSEHYAECIKVAA